MRAAAAAALAAGLVWVSLRAGSPGGEAAGADDYPLAPGMEWTYAAPAGVRVVRRAEAEKWVDGKRYVMVRFGLPIGSYRLLMRRTREGVVALHGGREHLLMRFPMKAGDRWRIDVAGMPGVDDIADCEVVGPEEVGFLGRRATATKLRVTRTNRKSGRKAVDYEWYAPGIGLVRMEVTYGLRAVFALERFDRAE